MLFSTFHKHLMFIFVRVFLIHTEQILTTVQLVRVDVKPLCVGFSVSLSNPSLHQPTHRVHRFSGRWQSMWVHHSVKPISLALVICVVSYPYR